jgi:hypothetical protein
VSLRRLIRAAEGCLAQPPAPLTFGAGELEGLPEPVRRYFEAAIAPGTPVARSASVRMRGHIKIGRWLPFRARQILSPHRGFVWAARAAGVITGSDRFIDGVGGMDWKLLGLVTVMHAEGQHVSRSAAGRAAGEMIWLPTAGLPRFGVRWSAGGNNTVTLHHDLGDDELAVECRLDADSHVATTVFDRWGDPDGSGQWALYPFGGEVTGYATFDGLTIPSAGRFGWHFGTERWPEGEFFRYQITGLQLTR